MESASSENDGSGNIRLHKRQRTDNIRSAMVDFDVLDCPICFEPLNIPIFQCDNGHLACSSCCAELSDKCPSCTLPIGHIRCRAMESVLESILIPCQNATLGCAKKVSYGKVSTHEKECAFSLCSCPVLDCNYTGPYKDLYDHYRFTHLKGDSRQRADSMFKCGVSFSVQMNISDKILIKREGVKKLLFVVQCIKEPYGVYVTVSCIAPSASEGGEFSYDIFYKSEDGHIMTYQSPEVKRIRELSFQIPQNNFMLIPHSFLRGDLLKMNVVIQKVEMF
ncbi:E3 ubiquitin-protein ligase SINA-like 7 [Eutrema salsugineum]|nr:E3 ubiquitin-protein ligase SINA-like 7 [Eutrema salsugineum]